MARSKSPSTATHDIAKLKENFKVTGNKKHFTNNRRSLNENKQMFEQSFTGSDINMSLSMKKEYQNFQGGVEIDRRNSQQVISRKPFQSGGQIPMLEVRHKNHKVKLESSAIDVLIQRKSEARKTKQFID